jgi:hypothetical protein
MKQKFFFAFTFLITNLSFGQLEFKTSLAGRTLDMADLNGHSLLKKHDPDATGSPFINDEWVLAKLTTRKGNKVGPLQIKLNIESNELYYIDSAGTEMIALEGLVKKIDCLKYYNKDSIRYVFKSGYPAIDKQNENYYYQVFTEGKVELLAKRFKYIRTNKEEISGEITKEFVEGVTILYVYALGIIRAFHPNKSFVISLLEDKEQLINKFIDSNKTNFKKTKDIVNLFDYYNSLSL